MARRSIATILFCFAALALALAASGVSLPWSRAANFVVVVDRSASVRGAMWEDALPEFAAGAKNVIEATDTIELPPDSDAAIVLTDGRLRFESPPLAAITAALDPALDDPADGRAIALYHVGDETKLFTTANGDDRWPENDTLEIEPRVVSAALPLWIGPAAAEGFATSAHRFRDQPLIVARDATPQRQAELASYVAELGGTLVLSGGSDSFAFGRDEPLWSISPLLPTPSAEPERWVVLIDRSGSMSASGRTDRALQALARAATVLPTDARIDVATFAADLDYLTRDASPTDLRSLPSIGSARGETNLQPALDAVLADAVPTMRVLLITDAEATVEPRRSPAAIDLVHVGDTIDSSLLQLIQNSGGIVRTADELTTIDSAVRDALADALRSEFVADVRVMQLNGEPFPSAGHHATSLAESATLLSDDDTDPKLARRQVGLGTVIAISGQLDPAQLAELARDLSRRPTRAIEVEVTDEEALHVLVRGDATAVSVYRDGEAITTSRTGPATFEATLTGRRDAATLVVAADGQIVHRQATASRYGPEFEHLGNDRAAAERLAQGGEVISSDDDWSPPRVSMSVPLQTPSAVIGTVCIAAGLLLSVGRR